MVSAGRTGWALIVRQTRAGSVGDFTAPLFPGDDDMGVSGCALVVKNDRDPNGPIQRDAYLHGAASSSEEILAIGLGEGGVALGDVG